MIEKDDEETNEAIFTYVYDIDSDGYLTKITETAAIKEVEKNEDGTEEVDEYTSICEYVINY